MADAAVGMEDGLAGCHGLFVLGIGGRVEVARRRQHRLRHLRFATNLEGQQTRHVGGGVRVARQLPGGQAKGTAPTGFDGDVLLALHFVADRRRENARAGGRRPDLGARIRTEGTEVAHAIALEDEVARGGQGATVPGVGVLHPPYFLFRHRVPGLQVALQTRLGRGLDFRDLRQTTGVEVHARVPAELALLEIGVRNVREASIHGGDVHEAGRRMEGHRLPAMRPPGAGQRQEGLARLAPARFRVFDGSARLHVKAGGPVLRRIRRGRQQLASGAIQHIEIAIFGCLHQHLARLAVDGQVGQHDGLRGGVVPGVARRGLVVPHVFAGVSLQRHDGRKIEIVATTGAANFPRPRRTIADPDVNEIQLGVVNDRIPDGTAAAELPPFAGPGLGGRFHCLALEAIGRVRRDRVEPPQLLACGRVISGDIATDTQLCTTIADEHLALGHTRRTRDGVTAALRRRAHAPHFLAGRGIDRHQATIERADIQLAFPGCCAAVHDVAAGMHGSLPRYLRVIGPQLLATGGIEREQLAPCRGHVHHAVNDQRCRFLRAVRGVQIDAPGQTQLPDIGVIHLLQRREALLAVGAAVAHPVGRVLVGGRQAGGIDGSGLRRFFGRLAGCKDANQNAGESQDENPCRLVLGHGKPRKTVDLRKLGHGHEPAGQRHRTRRPIRTNA